MEEEEKLDQKNEIQIRKNGQFWTAFNSENRAIGNSQCRNCITALIQKLTKNSNIYDTIIVCNEDGSVRWKLLTGVKNVTRNSSEGS